MLQNIKHKQKQQQQFPTFNLQTLKHPNKHPNNHRPLNPKPEHQFYNTEAHSWRPSHVRHTRKAYRLRKPALKQWVVGVPLKSLEVQKDVERAVFPLMDRQRYHYLLKAIRGVREGNKLSEIGYEWQDKKPLANNYNINRIFPESPNNNHQQYKQFTYPKKFQTVNIDIPEPSNSNHHTSNDNPQASHQKPTANHNQQLQSLEIPNIVNITSKLKTRKEKRSLSFQKDNSFQRMFKNKRKLQNRYLCGSQGDDYYELTLLGEEELTIHQVPFHARNHQ